MSNAVVRVNNGPDLLRATVTIHQGEPSWSDRMVVPQWSWEVDVEGNLSALVCRQVPVVLLARGHRLRLAGEVIVTDVECEVRAQRNEPMRYVWRSKLSGTGPLTVVDLAARRAALRASLHP